MPPDKLKKVVDNILRELPPDIRQDCFSPYATILQPKYVIIINRCIQNSPVVNFVYEKLADMGIDTSNILIISER